MDFKKLTSAHKCETAYTLCIRVSLNLITQILMKPISTFGNIFLRIQICKISQSIFQVFTKNPVFVWPILKYIVFNRNHSLDSFIFRVFYYPGPSMTSDNSFVLKKRAALVKGKSHNAWLMDSILKWPMNYCRSVSEA